MKYLFPLIFLAGCTTARVPEPVIVTQEVKVPVALPCVPENYKRERPDYVDSDEALKAAIDAAVRYQLLWSGREQRKAREAENEAALSGCL